jgi:hypothetical protein
MVVKAKQWLYSLAAGRDRRSPAKVVGATGRRPGSRQGRGGAPRARSGAATC